MKHLNRKQITSLWFLLLVHCALNLAFALESPPPIVAEGEQLFGDLNQPENMAALMESLSRPKGAILAVAFSPDGKTLATGSTDKNARLWDTASGYELRALKGHTDYILSVAFSPDGKTLATGSEDNSARLWNMSDGRELHILKGHTSKVWSVAFSPYGKTLATGSKDTSARLWDTSSGRELHTFKGHTHSVNSVAFSPDGKTLATGSSDNTARLWDISGGREFRVLKGHTGWVNSVAFSPDGNILATGSSDNSARLWDTSDRRELHTLKGHADIVWSVAFSPDGKTLATGSSDNSAWLWDTSGGREFNTIKGHAGKVWSVAFSPDGKTLATGSSDNTVGLRDTKSGNVLQWYTGEADRWLSCRADGLCWRYDDGELLRQWNKDDQKFQKLLPPKPILPGQLIPPPPSALQVHKDIPAPFSLTVRNSGQGVLYGLRLTQRDKTNKSPLVLQPPPTLITLAADKSVTLKATVSLKAAYKHSKGGKYDLDLLLHHAHDNSKPQSLRITVTMQTSALIVEEARLIRNGFFWNKGYTLKASLRNSSTQTLPLITFGGSLHNSKTLILSQTMFGGSFTKQEIKLDEINRDKKIAPGEAVKLSFALSADLRWNKNTRLSLSAQSRTSPPHKWTFSNQPMKLPLLSWQVYAAWVLAALLLSVFIYYWRVFHHPLVLNLSHHAEALLEMPLEQQPAARRWLRRAGRWQTVLSGADLPLSRWQAALTFQPHADPARAAEQIAAKLGIQPKLFENISAGDAARSYNQQRHEAVRNIENLKIFHLPLGDTFLLDIEQATLVFPPADCSDEILLQALQPVAQGHSHVAILISTDGELQTRLQALQQQVSQDNLMWTVPDNRDLSRLLLCPPARAGQVLAQIIAGQVTVTRISPYQSSGGVKKAGMFFGRERLLADILNREPRNYLVIGARQAGKSSLLRELERRYAKRPEIRCFYLSVSRVDLLRSLCRLTSSLNLPDDADGEAVLAALAQPPAGLRYVLLLDEADNFIRHQAAKKYPELHRLRNLSEEGRCQFILAGFWELYAALSLDYQSPLKNFGEILMVGALEPEACTALVTQPMSALGLHYADPGLKEILIRQSGARANLIATACDELVRGLDGRREIEAEDVRRALDSQAIQIALASWGNLAGKDNPANRLDRLIVWATVENEKFDLKTLWAVLDGLEITPDSEQVQQSLSRLELGFILERRQGVYRYRVPLLIEMLRAQEPARKLREAAGFISPA
ncbi:MAG: AAA family ATPase [Gammaproteobacteria bacterium]|nr:AAA family ATPase [Gammaproteobacteria bacterium]